MVSYFKTEITPMPPYIGKYNSFIIKTHLSVFADMLLNICAKQICMYILSGIYGV